MKTGSIKNVLNPILRAVTVAALIASTASSAFAEVDVIRPKTSALNDMIRSSINTPNYFSYTNSTWAALPTQFGNSAVPSPVLVYDYNQNNTGNGADYQGQRFIVVRGSDTRLVNSEKLGESGIFQAGDIALSYRPEWYGTLRYSHVQLGISHAALLYLTKDASGKTYLRNLDMPMDDETVGHGYLTAAHYTGYVEGTNNVDPNDVGGTMHIQVVRPTLSDKQRQNINQWILKLAQNGPHKAYPTLISFNKDYSSPNYTNDKQLGFVADLGRIALGAPMIAYKHLTMYCSEFVWSVLSLRDCDPVNDANDIKNNKNPACVKAFFQPMPVLGEALFAQGQERANPNLTVGMIDGVPLAMADLKAGSTGGPQHTDIDGKIDATVFKNAGKANNISSGHRLIEQGILAQDPNFYTELQGYYSAANDDMAMDKAGPEYAQLAQARAKFNASQQPNYSPTAYAVMAHLSKDYAIKATTYVGTIYYSEVSTVNGQKADMFDVIKNLGQK